jgi:hypothetical protein
VKPLLAAALAGLALAAQAQQAQPPRASEARELIYCADLMSHEEREAYRAKMRATRKPEEKEALRAEHRRDMQERARQAGREGQCETAGRQWHGGGRGGRGGSGQ